MPGDGDSAADAAALRRRNSAEMLRKLTAESEQVLQTAAKSPRRRKSPSSQSPNGSNATAGHSAVRRGSGPKLGAPATLKGPRLSLNLQNANTPENVHKRRTSASPMIRNLAARAAAEKRAEDAAQRGQPALPSPKRGSAVASSLSADHLPTRPARGRGAGGIKVADNSVSAPSTAKDRSPSKQADERGGEKPMSDSKAVSAALLRSAVGPRKTSRERVREKFVRKYVRQALRKLRIILTTPRGDAIVNNEMRQQKEHRLFAENAMVRMRADEERWSNLLESLTMLSETPRATRKKKEPDPVTFPEFQIMVNQAFGDEIDSLHCEAMWNLLVAQLVDVTRYIFPKNIEEFLLGDLNISSDEDRAVKIILYQCEAQAHFYAHLAFSSTDGAYAGAVALIGSHLGQSSCSHLWLFLVLLVGCRRRSQARHGRGTGGDDPEPSKRDSKSQCIVTFFFCSIVAEKC